MHIRIAGFSAGIALLASLSVAQTARLSTSTDSLIDAMIGQRTYQVAMSPDGRKVAYVESLNDGSGVPSGNAAIYVSDLSGTRKRVRAKAGVDAEDGNISWSADSRVLAFLSTAGGNGQAQLYVLGEGDSTARRVTSLKGVLSSPRFSPDGKSVALLITENTSGRLGPLAPTAPDRGLIGEKVIEQRIAIIDLSTGAMRLVTPADMHVYHCDWSPDSRHLAAIAVKGSGTNNYWTAGLQVVDVAKASVRSIYQPPFQIANVRWSPDGKAIDFIEGLMSDEGATGGDLYTIAPDGGEAVDLTPHLAASIMSFDFAGGGIVFTQFADGHFDVGRMELDGRAPRIIASFDELISDGDWPGVSISEDGLTGAVVRSSFAHPYEVWGGPIEAWKQLTTDNLKLQPQWGSARNLHWTNEGKRLQGWLLAPSSQTTGKGMIVSVHGGPASLNSPGWPSPQVAALASRGYYVFLPNPRGSYGQGDDFTMANVRDFGYGDLRDIIAGVREALRNAPVDDTRVGITGWSYGGFMSMWAVTQTTMFRAAVAGAGISNWQSYYGQNEIDEWMIPYFGASVYDDPDIYARSSAIHYIKNVKTPTLLLVGERDAECPAAQSFEFYRALRRLSVPTQMVVFENEGHRISKPEHRREVARRMVDWFDLYLK